MGKIPFHSLTLGVIQGIIENEDFPPLIISPIAQRFNLIGYKSRNYRGSLLLKGTVCVYFKLCFNPSYLIVMSLVSLRASDLNSLFEPICWAICLATIVQLLDCYPDSFGQMTNQK